MTHSPSSREPRSPNDRVHEDQNPTPQISEEVSVKVPEEVIDSSSETVRQSSKCSAPDGLTPLESELCGDCPPLGYSTDKTRCAPCPRRAKAVKP